MLPNTHTHTHTHMHTHKQTDRQTQTLKRHVIIKGHAQETHPRWWEHPAALFSQLVTYQGLRRVSPQLKKNHSDVVRAENMELAFVRWMTGTRSGAKCQSQLTDSGAAVLKFFVLIHFIQFLPVFGENKWSCQLDFSFREKMDDRSFFMFYKHVLNMFLKNTYTSLGFHL